MRKHWAILILGILTALMPFLGFPGAWKTFFFVVFGLVISVLVFLIIARERYERSAPPSQQHTFHKKEADSQFSQAREENVTH